MDVLNEGTVQKIYLKNFMTHTEVILKPKKSLNLIIGSNGTGKSTIIAAIILGLGGSLKILGRTSKVSDYIRHGCKSAKTIITLFSSQLGLLDITRVILENNSSLWSVNGIKCTLEHINSCTETLNIQLDNLCQFLPQDRVQDFAKMSKTELLVNTQKAVGRHDLVEKQETLIDLQYTISKSMDQERQLKEEISEIEKNLERMAMKIGNVDKGKEYLTEIDLLKKKLIWIGYTSLHEELKLKRNEYKTEAEKLKICEDNYNDVLKYFQEIMKNLKSNIRQYEETKSKYEKNTKSLAMLTKEIQNHWFKINFEIPSKQSASLNQHKKVEHDINSNEQMKEKLENDMIYFEENNGPASDVQREMTKLQSLWKTLSSKYGEIESSIFNMTTKKRKDDFQMQSLSDRIADLENVKKHRLSILRKNDPDAYKGVLWLRENKHLFKGVICEPMILELNTVKPEYAKFFENIISRRDRFAFTCESREDMNILLRNLRDQQNLHINALHSEAGWQSKSQCQFPIPLENLKEFGIIAYASTLIKGPEPIMNYLFRMYKLHKIPIGNDTTYKRATDIPSEFKVFFSRSHRFSVTISRYSGEKSSKVDEIQSDGTFSVNFDHYQIMNLKKELEPLSVKTNELKEHISSMQNEQKKMSDEKNELSKKMNEYTKKCGIITDIQSRIKELNDTLNILNAKQTCVDSINERYSDEINTVIDNFMNLFDAKIKLQEENLTYQIQMKYLFRDRQNFLRKKISIDDKLEEQETIKNEQTAKKNLVSISITNYEIEIETLSENHLLPGSFDIYQEKFKTLPCLKNELNSLINELQTKIECLVIADDGEIKIYEENNKQLQTCTDKLHKVVELIRSSAHIMHKEIKLWKTPLIQLVADINKNFTSYFALMGCAGEIQLFNQGDLKFDTYGISIKVTFRSNCELQELNGFVQSGGERALTTAVYMLALQDLTTVPFRCIDEINQGMDVQNERRIFEILANITTRIDACQYFLITPKLIENLTYSQSTNVCIVHNGPNIRLKSQDTDYLKKSMKTLQKIYCSEKNK